MEYLSPRDGGLPSPKRIRAELILILLFSLLIAAILLWCSRALAAPVPVVRVMVEREKQGIRIEGFDLVIGEADTSRRLAHESKSASINVKCSVGGRMEVDLGSGHKMRVSGPLHVTSLGGFVRVGSSQYRDDLYVYSFNNDCIVVNHVDLEKYIAGLLNSEMNASWSSETLMAQAVAARTYAIYQMRETSTTKFRALKAPFDLESTVKDQVYEGAHKERYKALRAVQETRGQVLTFNSRPIKAFYHSTCGGKTETPEKVWGAKYPYMKAVTCGYCNRSPRFNWKYTVGATEFEQRLRNEGLLKGKLINVQVISRNNLGRADKVEIRGSEGSAIVSGTKVRELAGTLNLKSTDFSIFNIGNKLTFVGHGSGHGVGMCQWGAKYMGDKGLSHAQILKHYYPAAELTKLY